MATKLFIGKLSFDTTEKSLTDLFAQYGEVVSVAIIMDRVTNKSRGFGFVELADEDAANKAIAALDGNDFEGQKLTVSIAKPREDSANRGAGFKRSW